MAWIEVAPVDDLPPGSVKLVHAGQITVGVYNLAGEFYAIEDRCSHDDGPLCEGDFDVDEGIAICPRHGANIDIRTGRALTLPAVLPVEVFTTRVEDGVVEVDLS
jgi:3-phenylpropionate/trans-cinnamate dioxygenase ferredoxin subunit